MLPLFLLAPATRSQGHDGRSDALRWILLLGMAVAHGVASPVLRGHKRASASRVGWSGQQVMRIRIFAIARYLHEVKTTVGPGFPR